MILVRYQVPTVVALHTINGIQTMVSTQQTMVSGGPHIRYMIVSPNLYHEISFDFGVKIAHI